MYIEQIAKLCHEVNKAYCESIGDYSQVSWEAAEPWQRQSIINGVKYHVENPRSKPEDSHVSWLKEKIADGWVYGEVKDTDKKTHPCCVSYDQLPTEQKSKDYIFTAIVKTLKDQ
jgi:hypothetical protein